MEAEQGPGAFAEVLRRLRETRSLTQEELAERAALTVKAVGALERGERRRPYPHTVRSLADALALTDAERAELVTAVPSRSPGAGAASPQPPGDAPDPGTARTSAGPAPAGPSGPGPAGPRPPATTLVGREDEVTRLLGMLGDGARLVTLTGPGGVGKTRLAHEVLARAADRHPGGAAFVDLAPVREPGAVLPRFAAALGLPETPGGSTPAALARALTGRRVIVVLDNLEQVLGCAPLVADLVALAPDLVVVATSRAPLRVRAEHEVVVSPLDVPAGDALDEVTRSPAVAMFVERAAASGSDLEVTDATAAALAGISRRLDGIPLALELAAAATRLLPPTALLDRLDAHGVVPVTGAPRDLPARQQTMTAVLDWSVDLLGPGDAALLGRLAAFSGGFSLDSVAAVGGLDPVDAVTGVASLGEQSLVTSVTPPDAEPRFRLLEPVRQYATSHLRDEALDAADAHAAHFHRRARDAHRRLQRGEVGPVLDRLEADHANLRAAFLRLLELDRVDEAAELAGAVWLYLGIRGRVREGLDWLDRLRGAGSDVALAWAGVARLGLCLVLGDVEGMRREASVAVPLARRVGDPLLATEASVLAGLGEVFGGDAAAADRLLVAHPDLSPEDADWLRVHEDIGRGQLALVAGDVAEAHRRLVLAVDGARALGNEFTLATALNTAATVAEVEGDDVRAATLLGEALDLSARLRLSWSLGYSLPALAGVAGRVGDPTLAATLFGAAATLTASDDVDAHFPPSRETADRGLVAARDALGEGAFLDAWDVGRSATPDEVADLARRVVADLTSPGRG